MAKNHSGHGTKRPQPHPVTKKDLEELYLLLWWAQRENTKKIMAKLSTLSATLSNIDDQLEKAKNEITGAVATLQKNIDDLKAQIEAGSDPEIPEEAQAALDKLTGVAQALDDLNVDNPGPVTTPEEPPSPQTASQSVRPTSKLNKPGVHRT
jgi:hypothetical protein